MQLVQYAGAWRDSLMQLVQYAGAWRDSLMQLVQYAGAWRDSLMQLLHEERERAQQHSPVVGLVREETLSGRGGTT